MRATFLFLTPLRGATGGGWGGTWRQGAGTKSKSEYSTGVASAWWGLGDGFKYMRPGDYLGRQLFYMYAELCTTAQTDAQTRPHTDHRL